MLGCLCKELFPRQMNCFGLEFNHVVRVQWKILISFLDDNRHKKKKNYNNPLQRQLTVTNDL